MVNIKNSEIKLLKELVNLYIKTIGIPNRNYELMWNCQNIVIQLEFDSKAKKQLNKEQYNDRVFWKKYDEAIKSNALS